MGLWRYQRILKAANLRSQVIDFSSTGGAKQHIQDAGRKLLIEYVAAPFWHLDGFFNFFGKF